MTRILTIAEHEFLGLVRNKFFIISLFVVPGLMALLFVIMGVAGSRIDRTERRFGVVDRTGELYDAIQAAALRHNEESRADGEQTGPVFLPVRIEANDRPEDDLALELSAEVRGGRLFAFVDIPADLFDGRDRGRIKYYSESTSYTRLSSWLASALNQEIQRRRLERAGMDAAFVASLTARTPLASFGLVERERDGTLTAAREVDEIERFGVPIFFLVLMFMSVMSTAQHLINTIIEEKMSKISEVLLGSVSAFQLLAGKLVGIVAVSLLLAFVYLGGGAYALLSQGRPDLIDLTLAGWFLVFLICASLLFGAVFQALSAACSDLKDAQSLLQPAMMILVVAYFASFLVLRAPDSALAAGLSFVPLISPFAMVLRLAMAPGPPLWQVLSAVVLLIGTTVVVVWAAGRIFRVGLLMQGKPPNVPELLRWIGR
jgi:ABC-2 type transport system permease protein